MSNTFDEVDDILSDVESVTSEMESTDLAEKNFNESELQDIMAEIENLEKELEAEALAEAAAPARIGTQMKQTELQDEIDSELEMSLNMKEEACTPVEAGPKVLAFEKKSPATYTAPVAATTPSSEISFEAHGQMNLNLGFKIGEESARLTIDPVKGLVVTMSGVELCINQEDGCKVTMDTGVKFTIPLTSSESALKKKSA